MENKEIIDGLRSTSLCEAITMFGVNVCLEAADLLEKLTAEQEPERPKIVCLCGSTKFKKAFIGANFRETMDGNIVLSVGWFSHSDAKVYFPTAEEKIALDELHKRKIDLCDEVLVLNVDGYIGESTRSEIDYAEQHGKPVRYLEPNQPAEKKPETLEERIDRLEAEIADLKARGCTKEGE